jgi:AcrR family transcriptional regulator
LPDLAADRILTRHKAFTRFGAEASLDDIAREAGVGAGTLYRHFPTRDTLIEAVYRSEVDASHRNPSVAEELNFTPAPGISPRNPASFVSDGS